MSEPDDEDGTDWLRETATFAGLGELTGEAAFHAITSQGERLSEALDTARAEVERLHADRESLGDRIVVLADEAVGLEAEVERLRAERAAMLAVCEAAGALVICHEHAGACCASWCEGCGEQIPAEAALSGALATWRETEAGDG